MSAVPPRVVVVGGGFAGLAAAWRLARGGIAASVLERAPGVGGRAASVTLDGAAVDPAAPLVSTGDRALRDLLRTLGRESTLVALSAGALEQAHRGRLHPMAPFDLASVVRLPDVRWWHGLRVGRLERLRRQHAARLDPRRPERGARLDDRSLGDFARLYFGRSVLERWAGPLVSHCTLAREEDVSRLLFLLRHAAQRDASAATIAGGTGLLADALAARMAVRVGAEAVALERREDGRFRVRTAAGEEDAPADAVVIALPAAEAARLAAPFLVAAERAFFAGARTLAATSLVAALAAPVAGRVRRVAVPHAEHLPLESITLDPRGFAVAIAGDAWSRAQAAAPDDALAKELAAAMEGLVPGARPRASRIVRWPAALPRFEVGRYRAIDRFRRVQSDRRAAGRRLYFAGDWLVDPSLEGALVAGARAADELVSDLRRA